MCCAILDQTAIARQYGLYAAVMILTDFTAVIVDGKNGKSYQECCVIEECPLVLKEKYIEQW